MFRWFVLLVVLVVSLQALSDQEILRRANKFVKSSSKTNQFRAYNDYKNLYLRALMNEDKRLKLNALRGIVKSGNKLHIDVSQYEDELKSIKITSAYKPPKSKKIKKRSKKNLKVISSHKLKSIRWRKGRLVLKFNKKLHSKQINYFTLYDKKTKLYKYIFDIHASMSTKSQTLQKSGVKSIKIAQYNSNTLRLVIANPTKLKVRFKYELARLYINIQPKNVKKVATKKKTKSYTPPHRIDRDKVIVIDAGHGGKDPGAVGYRHYREKIVVYDIAKELSRILKSRGYKVYMTRNGDKFVKLSHRTKFANRKKADIFISIHANAVGKKHASQAEGIECYFLSTSRSERAKRVAAKENSADLSDASYFGKQTFLNTLNYHNIIAANKLAIDLQRGALGALNKKYKGVKDAGVREGPFWVLVGAQMPSVLVEVGFITHPKEARRLVSKKYQKTLAQGLANGVERYFLNNQ